MITRADPVGGALRAAPTALDAAARSADEPARLAMLRSLGVVDGSTEERFQDLVRLAAWICGTTSSAVSFVDADRQWFKARHNVEPCETPREQSFCAHALDRPAEVLVVPDARSDPRFADNPLVTQEPGIRFYAGAPMVGSDGRALGTVCVLDDRPRELDADQREALAALARLAVALLELGLGRRTRDAITGLPDREAFEAWLSEPDPGGRGSPAGAEAAQGPLARALLVLDLDGFRRINLALGAQAADEALRVTAQRLLETAGEDALVARRRADQFLIAVPGRSATQARQLGRRLAAAVSAPIRTGGETVELTASVGVAWQEQPDRRALLREATLALEEAKRRGPSQLVLFDEDLRQAAQRRWRLEADLARAAERGQLWLAYQPLVDLETREVRAAEALLRWHHPTVGAIDPEELTSVARAAGLTHAVGSWALDQALGQLRRWRTLHPEADIGLGLNVDARQLEDPRLVSDLASALQSAGVPPRAVTLELTEHDLVGDTAVVLPRLQALRALGVRLAIDDFGTGTSSLAELDRLPVNCLKLDARLLDPVRDADSRAPVATAVIRLADALGLEAVAEGVEREEQVAWLRAQGVQRAHGPLLGEATGADTLAARLR